MNKLISIALCTYNGEKFLSEQLESFTNQSRLPDELVVCDDCSSDKTPAIIENFCKTAPFPVRFHQNHSNLRSTKNFEKAIGLCTGDLVFLSDQDDVWEADKIKQTISVFENDSDVALVFTNALLVDENLKSLNVKLWDKTFDKKKQKQFLENGAFELLLKERIVTGATVCFKKELNNYVLPIPILYDFIHDGWLPLIAAKIGKVVFIDENLVKYRQHSSQQIGALNRSYKKHSFQEILATHKRDLSELEQLLKYKSKEKNFNQVGENKLINLLAEMIESKQDLINHLEFRASLPKPVFNRLIKIYNELRKGTYHRFERGFLTAGKDLLKSSSG